MSVADHFGLDDSTSPLLARARAAWRDWRTRHTELAVVDDLLDLRGWTRRAPCADKDPVLHRLAALAENDDAARIALVWLLIPGATALADRLRDPLSEIDGSVAGQLWIEVARSHRLGPRWIAKAILNETRRQVTAELGVGHQAMLRDKAWAEILVLDRFEEQAVLVEPPPAGALRPSRRSRCATSPPTSCARVRHNRDQHSHPSQSRLRTAPHNPRPSAL